MFPPLPLPGFGSLFKYLSAGLFVVVIILSIALGMEKRSSAKKSVQLYNQSLRINALQADLDRISAAKNNQKETSQRNVEKVTKQNPTVRTIVRTIKEAPNPNQCATPALDTLRDVL